MISAHLSFVLDGRDAVPKEFVVVEAAVNSRLLKRDLKRFDQTFADVLVNGVKATM